MKRKTRQRLVAILATAFLLPGSFPVSAQETGQVPEDTTVKQESAIVHGRNRTDDASLSEMTTVSGNVPAPEDGTDFPLPDEVPAFHARLEYRMGYTVTGTFKDFTPDIIQIRPLYSLDGEIWQTSTRDWNLLHLDTHDEDKLKVLQNQPCLFSSDDPLKSYIAGKTDRFYLKLCITKENGLSYETQSAVIERGGLQPIPEGTECRALFSSSIAVRERYPAAPYHYRIYGRYQITVSADATAEEISALLPDTLPIEVQLDHGPDFIAIGIIDCPVTWKPLSLPRLSPGESITIPDAAEEILIPAGTLVSTPLGSFSLEEPLHLDTPPSTDEVRLVLNVGPEDRNPTGALREGNNGLEIAFHHKPTGAASIRAYVLAEGESRWMELPGLSLLKDLDQPSTANSGYALVLRNDQEPYQSYLAATEAGDTPTPFFIGLKIEGGLYDGRHLILAWPDIYEQLPDLPEIRGAEGNEGNAGADNKEDSTETGQRPDLPQIPDGSQEEQLPNPAQPSSGTDNNHGEQQQPVPDGNHGEQQQPVPDGNHGEQQQPVPDGNPPEKQLTPDSNGQNQPPLPIHTPKTVSAVLGSQMVPSIAESVSDHQPERQENQSTTGQHPGLPQTTADTSGTTAMRQKDSLNSSSLMMQSAEIIKDEENAPALSDVKTSIEHTSENNSRLHLHPMITTIIVGCCIGAAICKASGYRLFHQIAGKIRHILHI